MLVYLKLIALRCSKLIFIKTIAIVATPSSDYRKRAERGARYGIALVQYYNQTVLFECIRSGAVVETT